MALEGAKPLSELQADDEARFGAKAVNLGRLARWGFAVPSGFAVSASDGASLSDADRQRVLQAYEGLGGAGVHVAVRSSAVGEDRSGASFAGQHDSFLDVVGGEALVRAIERCLASRDTERAVAYRRHTGAGEGRMGVIVQRMVPAEFAGVCFTRAPGAEDEVAVELVAGLGERLVAGRERPALVRFERQGLTSTFEDDAAGALREFGLERAREVARAALAAERRFGFPVDVEWAFADGVLQFLQARPITGLQLAQAIDEVLAQEKRRLRDLSGVRRITVWSDFSIADMLPRPVPLALDVFALSARRDRGIGAAIRQLGVPYREGPGTDGLIVSICGRPYLNLSGFVTAALGKLGLRLDAPRLLADRHAAYDLAAAPVRIDWSNPACLLLPFRLLWLAAVVPVRFFRMRRSFHDRYVRELYPRLIRQAAEQRSLCVADLSLPQLWERLWSYTDRLSGELLQWHQLSDILSFATRRWLVLILRMLYGENAAAVEVRLTTALAGNFNTESNLALADVAAGRLTLVEFLDRYGHRGHPDWDISAPRWREDPGPVEQMVQKIHSAAADPSKRFEEQRERRVEAELELDRDLRKHPILRWGRRMILRELSHYQRYSPLREVTQSACYLWVELARRVLLEAAQRTGADDLLFYLKLDELRRFLGEGASREWLDLARERRRRMQLARRIYVPHVIRSDELDAIGRPPAVDRNASELRGLGVSSGVARGRARVVGGLDEARDLLPGEILVARTTDPAWTPLFFVAGGLVLEQGGLLSHGAIVAREQGLPAIVNVPHATRIVRTGQELTVLADAGRVLLREAGEGGAAP